MLYPVLSADIYPKQFCASIREFTLTGFGCRYYNACICSFHRNRTCKNFHWLDFSDHKTTCRKDAYNQNSFLFKLTLKRKQACSVRVECTGTTSISSQTGTEEEAELT